MNSRKLFALFLVLALTGSALAVQQQRLYRTVQDNPSSEADPEARGLIAIQQHSVFVEIIVEVRENVTQIHQFAAVVGLVKKCKQVRNVFDNAVLWFNDQFLFGNKSNRTVNVTPPNAMGRNPERIINDSELTDPNRNNGSGTWDPATNGAEVDEVGGAPNEGGNPDRDGFVGIRPRTLPNGTVVPANFERWGGCFIPRGFVHAIGADDPLSTGKVAEVNGITLGLNNIANVKSLLSLDRSCSGCIFEYAGSFYITDPNNHRWVVDKLIYPVDVAQFLGVGEDPTDCHANVDTLALACGLEAAERHRDRSEDNGIPEGDTFDDPQADDGDCKDAGSANGTEENCNENFDNHCYEDTNANECWVDDDANDPTDTPGENTTKFTTKEPIFTVHVQVDPWNPDRQGFPDEAIWAYRQDSKLRLGLPYSENISDGANGEKCHDLATIDGANRTAGAASTKADAYEFDNMQEEGGAGTDPTLAGPKAGGYDWAEFRRGAVGTTVECAIEYNFLIAVDFEAFDDLPEVNVSGVIVTQEDGEGENELIRDAKEHGDGGADEADKSWQGNSHPHNPTECDGLDQDGDGETCDEEAGPKHKHDVVSLDLFFSPRAAYFVEQNPYWDHANATDVIMTTGTPPVVDDQCKTAPFLPPSDYRRKAVEVRIPIVCDVDSVDGFHLHDGSQTPRPSQP